jgi:hypothetical protein
MTDPAPQNSPGNDEKSALEKQIFQALEVLQNVDDRTVVQLETPDGQSLVMAEEALKAHINNCGMHIALESAKNENPGAKWKELLSEMAEKDAPATAGMAAYAIRHVDEATRARILPATLDFADALIGKRWYADAMVCAFHAYHAAAETDYESRNKAAGIAVRAQSVWQEYQPPKTEADESWPNNARKACDSLMKAMQEADGGEKFLGTMITYRIIENMKSDDNISMRLYDSSQQLSNSRHVCPPPPPNP